MTKKVKFWVCMCLLMTICCGKAFAAGYMDIKTGQLKALLEKKTDVLIIFPLSKIEYNDLHIAGSFNIPIDQLEKRLPPNKEQYLVFYCLGEKCTASWRAAEVASKLGYKNVFAYREGLPAWVAAGYPTTSDEALPKIEVEKISTDDLEKALKSDDKIVLLDCSLPADAEKFHIDSSKRVYIPMEELHSQYKKLPQDKKIAVACLKGTRSPTAARFLFKKGFKNVVSLDGGVEKWVSENRPVVRSADRIAKN